MKIKNCFSNSGGRQDAEDIGPMRWEFVAVTPATL